MTIFVSNHCVERYNKRLLKKSMRKMKLEKLRVKVANRIRDGFEDVQLHRKKYLVQWVRNPKKADKLKCVKFFTNESTTFVLKRMECGNFHAMTCYPKER